MDWRALEEHFRAAGEQDPGPFGDDAIEWDHSRYARALGLTGEPGAHDLPHRACAVAAMPPARWDAVEKRFATWAERGGWTLWRVSARPTVAVPDPIAYALGTRASGPDAFAFSGAARPVLPVIGRRPRSEGMSFPLTPGERWLIAANRVRRRMRAEIAMRGVVLFVEEAEWLTPAGLAILMNLLDAQRAWKARMLARPARAYVVLATSPEHEAAVVGMLQRFHMNGVPPVVRDRRRPEAASPLPPALRDAEEEYLFGALAAAPAALSAEDVRSVFGASAVERCRAMVERGLLRERVEAGQLCYPANPSVPVPGAVPTRALAAIRDRYRHRARRGHEHLALAAAAISLMLDEPRSAVAAVARMPHTAGPLLPLRSFEVLDAALERARPRLRSDHLAAWFSLAANQRMYEQAQEHANAATECELRTWKELYRVVQTVLCTGRTHLDTCLPHDFWPRIKSHRIAGPFVDATCVLAEFFWRKRYLDDKEIRQRFEFAENCFSRGEAEKPRGGWFERAERFGRVAIYRAALHLDTPTQILCSPAAPQATLRSFVLARPLPGYLIASTLYAEAASGEICMPRSFHGPNRQFSIALDATAGHPADLAVTTASEGGRLSRRGLRLLARDVLDEVMLAIAYRKVATDRHDLGRALLCVAGWRGWLVATNAIYLRHGRQDVQGPDAFDEMAVGDSLLLAGDLAGARDHLATGLQRAPRCPLLLTALLRSYVNLARRSLDVELLGATRTLVDKHRRQLGSNLCDYLDAHIDGSEALCSANVEAAHRSWVAAFRALRPTTERPVELRKAAMRASIRAAYVRRVLERWASARAGGPSIWKVIRVLCSGPDWKRAPALLRKRAAACLDYLCVVVDAWATTERSDEEILRLALFLKDAVDESFMPLGEDFVHLMATWAPQFYEKLRRSVVATVGELGAVAAEGRALSAAIRKIEGTWKDDCSSMVDAKCSRLRIRAGLSKARQARRADRSWPDDATTYAQLWDDSGEMRKSLGDGHAVVAYGHVGPSAPKPVATALHFSVASVDTGALDVEVESQAGALPSLRNRRRSRRAEQGLAFAGHSESARRVRLSIDMAARCGYPVLILGETGVGKDLVARCIHAASGRQGRPLVTAECGGIVESLLESELFGHEKGAFTGAHAMHSGVFERGDGSSLLLDEADSMPKRMQATLLRVLESGEYRRVGSSISRKSDFRLMTAALPRLLRMVETGEFRQDLLYRISTLRIEIPPLRERGGDAEEIAMIHGQSMGFRFTPGARRAVAGYEWPGNVRQLRHCVQAAGLHATDGRIGEAAMSEAIAAYRGTSTSENPGRDTPEAAWARALRTLERKQRFGAWDFAKAAELSRRSAQRHIARLLREGRIVRMGAGRATRYGLPT